MGDRFSIYAGEPVQRLLEMAGADNRSGRINAIAERYLMIVADELGGISLSKAEWCAVMDANNGTIMDDGIGWQSCWANVMDTPELDEKWGVKHLELGHKLHALSLAGRAAVAEVCQRFWERCELAADEALKQAGVTLKE